MLFQTDHEFYGKLVSSKPPRCMNSVGSWYLGNHQDDSTFGLQVLHKGYLGIKASAKLASLVEFD